MWRPPSSTTCSCSLSVVFRASVRARARSSSETVSEVRAALAQRLPGEKLRVAPEQDVRAATGHVGGDGHRAHPARLRDDLGFLLVVLGVEDLVVGDAALLEKLGEPLRLLDRDRADEDRPPLLVELLDLLHDGVELLALGLVDDVRVVHADERPVGRDHRHVQLVDLGELRGLGIGGARHAGELVVHPEVVLEGDGGEGLVLLLDPEPFLRLDRLVEAVRPPAARHEPAGELVDDDDLAVLRDVVHVLLEQRVGAEALVDVVERVDVLGVVEVPDREQLLAPRDAGLGQGHRLRLLVDDVVALPDLLDLVELALGDRGRAREPGDDPVDLVVEVGRLLGRTRDDQRGPRLVDQDRVDLVDDRVVELAAGPAPRARSACCPAGSRTRTRCSSRR